MSRRGQALLERFRARQSRSELSSIRGYDGIEMPDDSRDTSDAPIGQVTKLLGLVSSGDDSARGVLFDLLYLELRRMAASAMRAERPDHTLQPTALVNEVYVRRAGSGSRFQSRAHFLAVAATAMRRMLIDHAR